MQPDDDSGVDLGASPAPSCAIDYTRPLGDCQADALDAVPIGAHPLATVPSERKHWLPAVDTELRDCPHNLDLTTLAGKTLLIRCANPGELELDKRGELRIRLTHFVVYTDTAQDSESGEVSDVHRTALVDETGLVFKTTSPYVAHGLRRLCSLFTPEDFARGIPVIVRTRPSKRHPGGSYHELSLDDR